MRDRDRTFRFNPDIALHAAALRYVPSLERDWIEGVGSVNVAAPRGGRTATCHDFHRRRQSNRDSRAQPSGWLRCFARCWMQSMLNGRPPMRLISVRFGNVLALEVLGCSRIKAQIEAGGPITVTHPDTARYFMTDLVKHDLVVSAAGHALGPERSDATSINSGRRPSRTSA